MATSALVYRDGSSTVAILSTMTRLALGFTLSILAGLLIAVVLYRFKKLNRRISPVLFGLQALPSVCWIPLAIILFGTGEISILFIMIMGSVFAVAISIEGAISNVEPLYLKAASTMGLRGGDLFKKVVVPASLPNIVQGLKQGWALGWRSLIAGEMIASDKGLGHILTIGKDSNSLSQIMAVVLIILILGTMVNMIFVEFENKLKLKRGLN